MAAPKGNNYWLKRSKHGREAIFSSPEKLWESAVEYFLHVDETPLLEYKAMVAQGSVEIVEVPKPRPYTILALCLFLNIDHETYSNYRKKDGFFGVTKAIDETIRTQKLEGAAAGLFNPNIIARDLGLKEATTNEHSGPDGNPIEVDQNITVEFVGVEGTDS